jgi:hypothetical protein
LLLTVVGYAGDDRAGGANVDTSARGVVFDG